MKIKSMRSFAVVLAAGAVVACNSAYQSDSASKESADISSLSPQEASTQETGTSTSMPALSVTSGAYPTTKTVAQVDNYHGVKVNDPYRWLEAQDTPEVKAWVDAQNALAKPLLSALPSHERYTERLTALWDYEKYSTPYIVNSKVFYTYNNGLQNQYVMYVSSDAEGEGKGEGNFDVLIDPNTLSDDGTVSMASTEVSPQAGYLAYTLSDGGSDWKTVHVRDVSTKQDMNDIVSGVKFTNIAWLPDETGFYYSRYPQDENGEYDDSQTVSIYFHQLGTEQGEDKLVFKFDDKPTWNPYPEVIQDGKTLLISVFEGYQSNGVYAKSLTEERPLVPIFDKWDGRYELIGEEGNMLFFSSTENAPTGKVIQVSLTDSPASDTSSTGKVVSDRTTIIQSRDATLRGVSLLGGKLFVRYLKDVKANVVVFDTKGNKLEELAFSDIGNVSGFNGSKNANSTFYKLTGFTNPGQVFKYDLDTGTSSVFKTIDTGVNYDNYVTKQVFYTSKDGTQVPMFIVHKKGIELDGNNKTLLYGYGGFNISLLPSYSISRMVWVEQGNVLAIANIRGGGEYGEQWHQAGTKLNKQNVFDDFISGANFLIDKGYTSSEKLAVQGGSNGGLLVGAVITQRPDLFAAALPAVGVLDMLRYHTPSANARAWSSDYGLSEDKEQFEALYAYSPLHNTKAGTCYPATMVTTGDHDDRVVPWHSYKFAAQLQADQGCDNPVLLKVETRAGHGAGTPTWMRIQGYADQWAFLEAALH
ncbi:MULTISPECIES: prolyl oligopeptidase family serine peptidase [unclassified Alteromonas]|uniref:prolyl oligopeptidase family serine peptidase n=1 Tax=unclassified Alteromonas TaxID=2614992 RepID=UPI000A7063DA|nr:MULTISPECIES: prolyl oligopeptidase family serine peptidase [unclassified Alteromonas]